MENYCDYGIDLERTGLITQKEFGYYLTRMVSVKDSVDFYMKKIKSNPFYCIDSGSLNL